MENYLRILKQICSQCTGVFKAEKELREHINNFHDKKPKGNLRISIENRDGKKMLVMALADTGANKTLISSKLAKELELKPMKTEIKLKNVQGESIEMEGEAQVKLRVGEKIFIDKVIIIKDSNDILLGFSHLSFAKIIKKQWLKEKDKVSQEPSEHDNKVEEVCECPERIMTPGRDTWENIERSQEAILNHFKSSAFNACTHKEIPTIAVGQSLSLHVDSKARPPVRKVKFHPVPIHLEAEVTQQLEDDVLLGVI